VSLILDALRKADAERERGSVPGLRSQPVVPLSEAAATPKSAMRFGWMPIAIGVAVGLALAAVWMMVGRSAQDRGTTSAAAPNAAPAVPFNATTAPSTIAAGDPLPASALTPVTDVASAPAATTPQDVAAPAPWPNAGERGGAGYAAKGDAQSSRSGGASASDAPVYPHDLLPSHIRAAVPQLAISGSIYSPDPSGRSLIVNGRLYREREQLTQDLVLEEIRLKSAIFGFRGYRFEVLY